MSAPAPDPEPRPFVIHPAPEGGPATTLRRSEEARRAALNLMEDAIASRRATERLNLELRESERRFREMIDALPSAVYTTDAHGRLTHFNPATTELAGRTPVLGTDEWGVIWRLYDADGVPLSFEQSPLVLALRQGGPISGVKGIVERPDGTRRWIEAFPTPLRDGAGEIVGGINMLVDVTERELAEDETRRSAATFLRLIEHAPFGVYVVDADFRIVQVNAGAQAAFASVRPLIGRDLAEALRIIWPEPFASEAIDHFRHTLETGEVYVAPSLTEKRLDVDSVESYEWQVTRVLLPDGRFGAVCYFFNLTHFRRIEVALLESEERFRTLADNMAQFAWTADAQGWIYWYNQRWYDYTGTTLEEMQGWGWTKVHHPDHLDRVVARLQHSWDSGEVWEDTFPLRSRDGSYRWFLSRAQPIRDEQGRVTRWFGTHTDVTEQLELADELRHTSADLFEADRRKNEFLAMLAHELRNPLAPLRNSLEIIRQKGSDAATVRTAAAVMERQVGHMVRLVDDLLDVSRITRGRIELRRERTDVTALIAQAVEACRPEAEHRSIGLSVALPDGPVPLDADPARLAQVADNLLSNALKFTGPGGQVQVGLGVEGRTAVLRVRDNGIGLAPDQLTRVFDLFMQVDISLERSISGLGIGLTLVKSLVELHGGSVEAKSPGLGQGTEFTVRLPLAPVVAALPKPPAMEPAAAVPVARRILVVDDNVDAAESLATVLELAGNDTRVAHDGVAALAAAETFGPEIVLLDIGLPRLNGYEVARAIRNSPWGANMRLFALTGWGQDDDRRKSAEAGFDAHLVKPVAPTELMKLLAARSSAGKES